MTDKSRYLHRKKYANPPQPRANPASTLRAPQAHQPSSATPPRTSARPRPAPRPRPASTPGPASQPEPGPAENCAEPGLPAPEPPGQGGRSSWTREDGRANDSRGGGSSHRCSRGCGGDGRRHRDRRGSSAGASTGKRRRAAASGGRCGPEGAAGTGDGTRPAALAEQVSFTARPREAGGGRRGAASLLGPGTRLALRFVCARLSLLLSDKATSV